MPRAFRSSGLSAVVLVSAALLALAVVLGETTVSPPHPLAPRGRVAHGMAAWHHHGCGACHTIFGGGSVYGPDLTGAYARLGRAGIRHVVRSPGDVTTWRSMPYLPVTDRELDDLVALLRWAADGGAHAPDDGQQATLTATDR